MESKEFIEESSPSDADPTQENVLSKKERLDLVISLIQKAPLCNTAEDAFQLVADSFESIESKHALNKRDKMAVYDLKGMRVVEYEGRKIYFEEFKRHALFIAENGSIDIRILDSDIDLGSIVENMTMYPIQNLKSELQKPGLDGMRVWNK